MAPKFLFELHRELVFQAAGQTAHSLPAHESESFRICFADKPDETIEARRRRRGSPGGPSGRADMPGRPSSSGSGGTGRPSSGGTGGGFPSSSGTGIPGGFGKLPIGVIILIIAVYFLFTLFSGNDETTPTPESTSADVSSNIVENTPLPTRPSVNVPIVLPTSRPTRAAASSTTNNPDQTWTILLYQDADDSVLEQDIYMDLNEAEQVGSSDQVNIVAQIDRYAGAYQVDGDWTTTRRYYLTRDNDLFHVHSKVIKDLGEVSMADPQTLIDFATWAIKAYPADKYVLILSDHGMGWPGGMTDPKPAARRNVDTAFAQAVQSNMMFTNDLDRALGEIREQTGIDAFEVVGLDACLMSHLEVYSALQAHTRYVVTSQETEPSLGWAYSSFLQALTDNPGMDGAQLSADIVSSYIDEDQRILNKEARADFLRQGSPLGSLFGQPADVSPAQLTQQIGKAVTLNAAEMDALPGLMDSLNQLAYVLQQENPSLVAKARTYAQSYTSVFGKDVPPSYIDLANFAQWLQQESSSSAVQQAASAVIEQVSQVVVAEKHGTEKSGSAGVSIYFPNSQLYQTSLAGARSYAQIADRFVADSLWDEFLAFHYTGVPFAMDSRSMAVPDATTKVAAPAAGQIEVSALRLSTTSANYDEQVTFEADLSGKNIGYVYLFVGYYDPNSNSILIADKDYLESPETHQVADTYYPNWADGENFTLKYTWTPTVFAIDDGTTTAVALLSPERYGASAEEAVYTSDGIFTSSSTGESRYARMYFSNGQLTRLVAYTGTEPIGMVSELIPEDGDQITLIQTWLESDGSGGYRQVTENGETLTFGSQTFTWKELYADAGTYVVGFIVSDLDGQEQQVLDQIEIR